MKTCFALLLAFVIGCTGGNGGDPGDPGDPGDDPGDPGDPDDDPIEPRETCLGDNNCICPGAGFCGHTCDEGATECHVQGNQGPVDVVCDENVECHVECTAASSCEVDCGGSAQCHVSCPDGNCEVTNCVGDCVVSCGSDDDATITGTTATCP